MDVVERDLLPLHQIVEIEAEGGHILDQILLAFLKGEEHSPLAVLHGTAHQEVQTEQCLAAPCPATQQRGAALREPTTVISSKLLMPVGAFSIG